MSTLIIDVNFYRLTPSSPVHGLFLGLLLFLANECISIKHSLEKFNVLRVTLTVVTLVIVLIVLLELLVEGLVGREIVLAIRGA